MSVHHVGFTIKGDFSYEKMLEGFSSVQDLKAPEQITEEKIEEIFTQFRCAYCSKEGVKNICGCCKNVSYCDVTCQKNDRSQHKNDCKAPIYYTQEKVMGLLKDLFKIKDLKIEKLNFLFDGEKHTRVHHLIAINNPECLTLEALNKLTVDMDKIIATDGTFPIHFNDSLKKELGGLQLYTGKINGLRAYDVFSNVTLKFSN